METKLGDYQKRSRETWGHIKTHNHPIVYTCLGLSNEVGEFLGKIKKIFRDKEGEIDQASKEELKDELGDVLWYFTQILTDLDLTLEEVAEKNLEKVLSRKERGKIGGSGDNR